MNWVINKKTLIQLLVVLVLTLPVIVPYANTGYFPTHDGEWAVVRLADMYRSIRDGQFPVRFSGYLNAGYGYPLFNFAYPFPYYLGMIPLVLGLGFVGSIKLLFALSVPAAAIGMFLLAKKLWGSNLAGFISAVLYSYFPYRFVDLFVRGSIGESLSFVLFPLILWAVVVIAEKPKSIPRILIGGTALGILIVTHNIMTVLFVPLLVLFIVLQFFTHNKSTGKLLRSYSFMLLFGLTLSFFFWFPALYEKQFIKLSYIPIADRDLYFVSLPQLLRPDWGYESPTEVGGFSYQIGIPHVMIVFLTIAVIVYSFIKKTNNKSRYLVLWLLSLFGVYIILMFDVSRIFWKYAPLFSEINYPWTILSQIGVLIALFGGYVVTKGKVMRYCVIGITILAVMLYLQYAQPSQYVDRGDDFYVTNSATTTSSDELMPLWVREKPVSMPKYPIELFGEGEKIVNSVSASKIVGVVTLATEGIVRVNRIYYPGWKVYIDRIEVPIVYDNPQGVMDVVVPGGSHTITAVFTETPYRLASNVVSLLAVLSGIVLIASKRIRI
ncbi:hypothetical protein HY468_03545 [Candidatus Roizmanbacteria bacterium]|nr:hypothetical protein [Candidatus Roizmanbacteria bacterium]